MAELCAFHDHDSDVRNHWIAPLADNIHPCMDHTVGSSPDTSAFHVGNNSVVVVTVPMSKVNET
jgi:hypothetical protein